MKKLIAAAKVRPGQEFRHHGLHYVRATDEEQERHPGRELAARRNRELVMAYSGEGDSRQPITFVPDLSVVVLADSKRSSR